MAGAHHTPYRRFAILTSAAAFLCLVAASVRAQSSTPPVPPSVDPATQAAQHCFERAQAAYFEGRLAEARRGFECAYKQLPSP
ncbi:MAG TPA: hypothetical protein VMF89_28775, partial [Polyangiales bacterium]|nr:hypothetical protein [Polyangiales bacterium]